MTRTRLRISEGEKERYVKEKIGDTFYRKRNIDKRDRTRNEDVKMDEWSHQAGQN